MLKLNTLAPSEGARKNKKRVGRGPGSGSGKTAARGHKGARSRTGYSAKPGFEGGQMPLQRRIPKRGFTNIFKKEYSVVNLERLNMFEEGSVITPELMAEQGLVKKPSERIKVLGDGELGKALTVRAHKFSKTAAERIEAAGGKAEVI